MNKTDLVAEIAKRCKNEKPHMREFIKEVIDTACDVICEQEKVTLLGFGVFKKTHRAARVGRNPKNGDPLHIEPRIVLTFKASVQK